MANYDYYRIFYYVAQYKSFSRAAEILENNQPNITRCMNNLENELGCKLFVRTNRGVTLTPEGTRLYEHVAVAVDRSAAHQLYQRLHNLLVHICIYENNICYLYLYRQSYYKLVLDPQ